MKFETTTEKSTPETNYQSNHTGIEIGDALDWYEAVKTINRTILELKCGYISEIRGDISYQSNHTGIEMN